MKVSELTGPKLDYWVAKALGVEYGAQYSSDWTHGGPIIEREGIRLERAWIGELKDESGWLANREFEGPTPLIAAMRAFVASKFGEEVNG